MIVTAADFANLSLLGTAIERLLKNARVVACEAMPPDVVTMNSQVVLVYETTGVRRVMTLVYPEHASAALDRVSVLHPAGMALLGARPGQIIEPGGPDGRGRLRLEKIVQSGDQRP